MATPKTATEPQDTARQSVLANTRNPDISLEQWIQETVYEKYSLHQAGGFANAVQLAAFLNSRTGKNLTNEIEAESALQHEYLMNIFAYYLLMERLRGLLLLWYIDGDDSHAEEIKELELQRQELVLRHKTATKSESSSTHHPLYDPKRELEAMLKKYDMALGVLAHKRERNEQKALKLLEELLGIELEREQHVQKHVVTVQYFNNLVSQISELSDDLLEAIIANPSSVSRVIPGVTEVPQPAMASDFNLTDEMAKMAEQVSSTRRGDTYYVNHLAQEVSNLEDAFFVLDRDQELHLHNNQYYLLAPGQKWDSVKNSPQELEAAKNRFNNQAPHTHKYKLKRDNEQTMSQFDNQLEVGRNEFNRTTATQMQLQHDSELLRLGQNAALALNNQAPMVQHTPQPVPAPAPAPKPAVEVRGDSFIKMLTLLGQPELMPRNVYDMAKTSPDPFISKIEQRFKNALANRDASLMQSGYIQRDDTPLSPLLKLSLLNSYKELMQPHPGRTFTPFNIDPFN